MSDKMSKEEIEQRLNSMSEELFSSGYLAGIKSVLPHVINLQENVTRLQTSLEDYLQSHDPNHGKPLEEIAKEAQDHTEELRQSKNEQIT